MKRLKKQWILFYGKVLSAVIALLGVASCSLLRRCVYPVMYGVPDPGNVPVDTVAPAPDGLREYRLMYGPPFAKYVPVKENTDTVKADTSKATPVQSEIRAMYGVTPVRYRQIETETGDVIINKYHQNP